MKLIILSDIHGNHEALTAVLDDVIAQGLQHERFIVLGDSVNYGPNPNEVVSTIKSLNTILVLQGNHERALFDKNHIALFASQRGIDALNITQNLLTTASIDEITTWYENPQEYVIDDKIYLFIHGSLDNHHWGKVLPMEFHKYKDYDVVMSGHTHTPSFAESNQEKDKKSIFINPGSVGQPRNHVPSAQYAIFDTDTESIIFRKCEYDIKETQRKIEKAGFHPYYKTRLEKGI